MHFISSLLLALATCVLAQLTSPSTFNCAKTFWPTIKPGDKCTVDAPCHLYPSYPRRFSGVKVSVAYTTSWAKHVRKKDIFDSAGHILDDALAKSLELYTSFSPEPAMPSEIVIMLARKNIHAYADTIYPIQQESPCQIRTADKWTNLIEKQGELAKQALAHELYHCVQFFTTGNGPSESPSSVWVLDGSANYFSNLVFPHANFEWFLFLGRPFRRYVPSTPIYAQRNRSVYLTSLYFQALETSRSRDYLNSWVLSSDLQYDGPSERNRLSNLPRFIDDFYVFAKKFSMGKIIDTSKVPIPKLSPMAPKSPAVPVRLSGGSGSASVATPPFTINVAQLSLKPGHTYTLKTTSSTHQRAAYRRNNGASQWTDIPSDSRPASVTIPCSGNVKVLILTVSTRDADTDAITVSVERKDENEECTCRGSKRGLLRRQSDECPEPPPPSTTSCKATTLEIDPCLTGHQWKLDLPALKALMLEKLGTDKIRNLELSGAGTLSFASKTAHFVYSNSKVDYALIGLGLDGGDLPVSLVINGEFDANVATTRRTTGGAGDMCLVVTAGSGSAVEVDELTGGFTLDLTPEGGFLSPDYDIKYTCSANALTMTGYLDGGVAWGPYAYSG